MIEINLLPLELRKKRIKIPLEEIFKTKQLIYVLGCIVSFHLLLSMVTWINAKRVSKLERDWLGLSSKKVEVSELKREFTEIDKKIPLIEQLISKRVLWSEKLNRISELIVSGVWLDEITIEEQQTKTRGASSEKSLIIRGSAASQMKDEPALIGRFMQSLKDDPSFSADFAEIELGPIKKRQIKETGIMDFTLICQFKQEKIAALLR